MSEAALESLSVPPPDADAGALANAAVAALGTSATAPTPKDRGAAPGLEASFGSTDFLLTRLYELESIDIYLDPGWLGNRPDLLEVYPYERHLQNFVQVFRRQYRRGRGRL